MVPRLKDLLFQHKFRDQVLWCPVDEVSKLAHFAILVRWQLKVVHGPAHRFGLLGPPLGVAEGVVGLVSVLVQVLDNNPAYRVFPSCER